VVNGFILSRVVAKRSEEGKIEVEYGDERVEWLEESDIDRLQLYSALKVGQPVYVMYDLERLLATISETNLSEDKVRIHTQATSFGQTLDVDVWLSIFSFAIQQLPPHSEANQASLMTKGRIVHVKASEEVCVEGVVVDKIPNHAVFKIQFLKASAPSAHFQFDLSFGMASTSPTSNCTSAFALAPTPAPAPTHAPTPAPAASLSASSSASSLGSSSSSPSHHINYSAQWVDISQLHLPLPACLTTSQPPPTSASASSPSPAPTNTSS